VSAYALDLQRLRAAQKSAQGAPAYSRFVNRRLGRYLAAAANQFGLTPNVVTAISAAFSASAIVLLCLVAPSLWLGLVVALLLATGYAFDAADGQLARLRGSGSPAGEWLDHMVDSAKICSLHLAVLVSLYRFGQQGVTWYAVPVVFAIAASVCFFGIVLTDQIRRAHGTEPAPGASSSVTRSLLLAPIDYGVVTLSFALLGAQDAFLVAYTFLMVCQVLFLVVASAKWFRELKALA
jgi:phosphatidylglycerophosphate synthase